MKFSQWLENIEELPDAREFVYLGCVLAGPIQQKQENGQLTTTVVNSQENLIAMCQRLMPQYFGTEIPANWILRSHHMTVKFKPQIGDMKTYSSYFGQIIKLNVTAIAADDNAIAVKVTSSPSILVSNAAAHITVAHARGISPVYSNTLLLDGRKIKPINESIPLTSVFLAVKGDQSRTWPASPISLASVSLI